MGATGTFKPWWAPAEPPAPAALREAAGVTIDDDEAGWRPLTGGTERDLTALEQRRMQKIAAWLWERNPLANRLVELPIAYLIGEGVWLTARNEDAAAVLRAFWTDPINRFAIDLEAMMREGELYGEQCYPAFVNEMTGAVRIGYLDPCLIETVVMDPDNPRVPIGIVTLRDRKGKARRYRVIVNGEEGELFTKRTQAIRETFSDGPCFYKRGNNLLGGTRGRSSMLAQFDWLDGYDEFLFGELDRARDLRSFIWDVTLTGATEDQVKARAANEAPPAPRSVRFHNDAEKWAAVGPSLNAGDSDTMSGLFRTHVLGGSTIPEHWYGAGGDVNRAVGAEMAEPTLKVLTSKQRAWKYFLEDMGRWVLAQAAAHGKLPGYDPADEDFAPEAQFPELTARDTTKYAAALQQTVASVVGLIDGGLLTRKTALALIEAIAGRLGVEFDAEAELEAAEEEAKAAKAARSERDSYDGPTLPDPADTPPQGADNSAAQAAAADE